MLFLVALTAAGLAGLAQAWSTAEQREREKELEYRGRAIARAIASYQRASVDGHTELPRTLDDLLEDRRRFPVRHHLRRHYVDPFTGKPDWELIRSPTDPTRFYGVRSRSEQALLRVKSDTGSPLERAKDWEFTELRR